jgi:anti-sigma factor RsiW
MTSNFDAGKHSNQEAIKQMDSLQRDRFELLSAYIDGEVTADERKQVQQLLATDSEMQRLYSRLTKLRQGMQQLPVPTPEATARETTEQVFSRIDKRRNRRVAIWGGAAIAALFVSTVGGILPGNRLLVPQMAQQPKRDTASEPLLIAVNKPLIEIPKAAIASPEKGVLPSVVPSDIENPLN